MRTASLLFLTALFILVACTSPETTRARGGPGADVGNRGRVVQMHEGARPYDKTPKIIAAQNPPLAPANQADQLSRR